MTDVHAEEADLRAAPIPAGTYAMDADHSALLALVPHNGGLSQYLIRFYRITGELMLDPAAIETSTIRIEIDPKSLRAAPVDAYKDWFPDSGFETWDEELANKEGLLNAVRFPRIVFTSGSVTRTGEFTADVAGTLSFLGIRKPVTMKATYSGGLALHPFLQVPAVGFSAEGQFNRSDFGMADIGIEDRTTIRFDGQFVQQTDAA